MGWERGYAAATGSATGYCPGFAIDCGVVRRAKLEPGYVRKERGQDAREREQWRNWRYWHSVDKDGSGRAASWRAEHRLLAQLH